MAFTGMRRLPALVILAALALSPAFPVGSACLSACGRSPARAAHACCRPRASAGPLTVRAPGCCRPRSENVPSTVVKAVEPVAKTGAALATLHCSIVPTAPVPRAATLSFVKQESPPASPPFRAILRI